MSNAPPTNWGPPDPNESSRPIIKPSATRKSAWRFATSSAATPPPRPAPACAPKPEPKMAKNVDNESLTRWGATPENADNDEPLTRWGPPEPQRPQKGPADRYLNITTGPAGIQYSVGSSNAQNNSFDSGNDAAVAVSAEWDADPNSNGEGASDEEVVGWDDTVFLPVDITIRSLKDDLVEIAQEHGVSIDYKDNTLRIRADTQDQLCTA
ncbi:hypothetical protein BDZ88DRAFT_65242 [Geranomyces variabilis]|nr:hypothetical protein BDZ88DRAFT_65242 [Geranomyces variabilis]